MKDSELALACLLAETGPTTGYGLSLVAKERGMERWAGLGQTSVYKGVRGLVAARVAISSTQVDKHGRGPAGTLVELTNHGLATTRAEVAEAIGHGPEQSTRFRIALSGADLLGPEMTARLLRQRSLAITERLHEVAGARLASPDPGRSLGRRLLFDYVDAALRHELVAIDRLTGLAQEGLVP